MKKKYGWILVGSGVFCFVIGVLWGVWSLKLRQQRLAQSTPLRVLCGDNWLPASALEHFSLAHDVRIEQYTYSNPSDFLRQMANADGRIDVVCSSSLLVRSLVRSHWLKKSDLSGLTNMKLVAVDFAHLPYDPDSQYTVPLFWNLYGFFGKGEPSKVPTWKQTWQSKKVSLWGDELNVLHLMTSLNLNSEERLVEEQKTEGLGLAFKKFAKNTVQFLKPATFSAEIAATSADWLELPLGRVARLLSKDSNYHFWLPSDGATMEVGVLGIGEKSAQPELARELINELISTPQALQTHEQMQAGVVHSSLSGASTILALQKAEALRQFPLNRLQFPDVDIQDLPRFQQIFNAAKDDE